MRRVLLPLLFATALAPLSAVAQEQPREPSIIVTGKGEATLAPDMAILNLAVTREAETAREALDLNNEAMAEVIAALKEAGIEDRDLQTSGLSIAPRYVYPNEENGETEPRITGYQVTNALTVRVRQIEAVGTILDRSVSLGVNQGGGIAFVNDDPSEAMEEARREAVEDAMDRASVLAEAAGVRLGEVTRISEQMVAPPQPLQEHAMMRMAASDQAAVPVETGENSYVVHVDVTFAIASEEE